MMSLLNTSTAATIGYAPGITNTAVLNPSNTSNHNLELLESLKKETTSTLYKFHTVFPFDFFPDEITIDENKVSIISWNFFLNYDVRSILIEDITDVTVECGPFFAALTLVDSSNFRFPITVKIEYLKKKEAIMARKLIQGLILTKNRQIGLHSLSISQARKDLSSLGETGGILSRDI